MIRDFVRFSSLILAVFSIALGCSKDDTSENSDAGTDEMDQGIGRGADPVVLTGNDLKPLIGRDPAKLVAFRYRDSWERVPLQVDERVTVDFAEVYDISRFGPTFVQPQLYFAPCYTDTNTLVGPDTDPTIDADDEVVFMYRDTGKRPKVMEEPKGVKAGSAVEVQISEPGESDQARYLYLFTNDGSLKTKAEMKYGQYSFSLDAGEYPDNYNFTQGPNPEDTWYKSKYYERHFTDRWLTDVIKIVASGSSGVDILDNEYVGIGKDTESCAEGTPDFVNNEGAFVTIKNGPVRSIRSYVGAKSGPTVQRTHIFYERREDIIANTRVHVLGSTNGREILDYSKEAVGMNYYDANNLTGLPMDGVTDDFNSGLLPIDALSYDNAWKMITGPQGSMVVIYKYNTDIPDLSIQQVYKDEAPAVVQPCQGDDSYYGASGNMLIGYIPCTELTCSFHLEHSRTIYYSGPEVIVDDAIQAAKNVYKPFSIKVTAEGSSQADDEFDDIKRDAAVDSTIDAFVDESTLCQEIFSFDKNGDGHDEERWVAIFDRLGDVFKEEWDKDADGVVDARWTITKQDKGRLVVEEWDDGADGIIEAKRINTSECSANPFIGNWQCRLTKSETDNNGDGQIDEVWTAEYDGDNLVSEKWDKDGDGVIEQKWEADCFSPISPDGNADDSRYFSSVTWDRDGDGQIDDTITYVWNFDDYNSTLSSLEWDKNRDGQAEESVKYSYINTFEEYTSAGYASVNIRLDKVERYQGDYIIAGESWIYPDEQTENLFETRPNREWDEDGDGIAETRLNRRYGGMRAVTYPDGTSYSEWSIVKEEWAHGKEGEVDEIITTTYGNPEDYQVSDKIAWDKDADGIDDAYCITYWAGAPAETETMPESPEIQLECDTDGDQLIDWRVKRTFSNGFCYGSRLDNLGGLASPKAYDLLPGLAKEREYVPRLERVFEKVNGVGTVQSDDLELQLDEFEMCDGSFFSFAF